MQSEPRGGSSAEKSGSRTGEPETEGSVARRDREPSERVVERRHRAVKPGFVFRRSERASRRLATGSLGHLAATMGQAARQRVRWSNIKSGGGETTAVAHRGSRRWKTQGCRSENEAHRAEAAFGWSQGGGWMARKRGPRRSEEHRTTDVRAEVGKCASRHGAPSGGSRSRRAHLREMGASRTS